MADKPLRFAVLCRVSTEKQASDRMASLANQEKQTKAAIDAMGGTITREYKGNQHATPGYEKAMVERLLKDAQAKRKPFDAVMVAEPSRWSRDNVANASGLAVFKANGVRFFCCTTEYDLFDPMAEFVLAQFANINQFFAATQKQKVVQAKIEYAKQGRPSCGTLPYGRTWDAERLKWGVDEAKQRVVQDAAKRYLAGEPLKALAAEYGMGATTLHAILRNHCGPEHTISFDVPDLNISEKIDITIPALLPAKTIKAIQRRMDRRRTGGGTGNNRYEYLLGGHVRCIECGACLSPQANNGTRYYRRAKTCTHIDGVVRADELERIVASHLVGLMGNPAAVAAAAKAYQLALGNIEEQRSKLDHLDKELAKIAKAQKKTMGLLEADLVDESMVHEKLTALRKRQHKLEDEREQLAQQLANVPTDEDVERAAKRAKRRLRFARECGLHAKAENLTSAELKALVAEAFADTNHTNGVWPGGVYIRNLPEWKNKRPRRWAYELHGNLPFTGLEQGVDYGHTDLPSEAFESDDNDFTTADLCVNDGSAP